MRDFSTKALELFFGRTRRKLSLFSPDPRKRFGPRHSVVGAAGKKWRTTEIEVLEPEDHTGSDAVPKLCFEKWKSCRIGRRQCFGPTRSAYAGMLRLKLSHIECFGSVAFVENGVDREA